MVDKKRPRIANKPSTPPPAADNWVKSAGVDPEIQSAPDEPETPPTAEPEPKGKAYPHRVSFDMETTQYKRLKRAAFDSDRAMNEVLREAVENWLQSQNY